LINWAKNTLYVEGFYLKVKRNNSRAIQFYKKNNFIDNKFNKNSKVSNKSRKKFKYHSKIEKNNFENKKLANY